jgi:hypothetical protein
MAQSVGQSFSLLMDTSSFDSLLANSMPSVSMSSKSSFIEISEKFLCLTVGSMMAGLSLAEGVGEGTRRRSALQEETRRTDSCLGCNWLL